MASARTCHQTCPHRRSNDAGSVRLVPVPRYDAAAEFYREGWSDTHDDRVTLALLQMAGPVRDLRVL